MFTIFCLVEGILGGLFRGTPSPHFFSQEPGPYSTIRIEMDLISLWWRHASSVMHPGSLGWWLLVHHGGLNILGKVLMTLPKADSILLAFSWHHCFKPFFSFSFPLGPWKMRKGPLRWECSLFCCEHLVCPQIPKCALHSSLQQAMLGSFKNSGWVIGAAEYRTGQVCGWEDTYTSSLVDLN